MDLVEEELKEESAEIAEQSVLGTVMDEVRGKVLYLKACGTAARSFDTMSALGVTLTQKWTLTAVKRPAKSKMDDLTNRVKRGTFVSPTIISTECFDSRTNEWPNAIHISTVAPPQLSLSPNEPDCRLPETNEEFLEKVGNQNLAAN